MKPLLTAFLCLCSYIALADGGTISGNTWVQQGATETYTVAFSSWDYTYDNYANVNWDVTGGSIIASDKYSVTVQWNYLDGVMNGQGTIHVSEDLGGQEGYLTLDIANNTE